MSTGRTVAVAVAALVGFFLGAYLGLYIVLATVDWSGPFEPEIILTALGLGTLLAIGGAVLVAPQKGAMWIPMTTGAATVGIASAIVLLLVDADPVYFIVVAVLEVVAIVVAARAAG